MYRFTTHAIRVVWQTVQLYCATLERCARITEISFSGSLKTGEAGFSKIKTATKKRFQAA